MLKLLTNKHVIIALIVAPLLAVLAWVAIGQLAGEKPRPATPGRDYPLVEQSNCRYESALCELRNEDFVLQLALDTDSDLVIVLRSSHPLDGVLMAVGAPEADLPPETMQAADGGGREWYLLLGRMPGPQERIRLVATAAGSAYFAEASTRFMQPDL